MNTETKTHSTSSVQACQNCKEDFTIEPDDFAFYERIKVPPPTWCPKCRLQRRLCFMLERSMYKRTCGLCGKSIVSNFPASRDVTTYCSPCWWSDKWDGLSYGRDYDPSRPFLEQFRELMEETPYLALEQDYVTLVNSDYSCFVGSAKNCYLITIADFCENVLYSHMLAHVKDSMDCTMLGESELCYGDINVGKSYHTHFSEDSDSCLRCSFVKDCTNCDHCFGCMGLRNKRYHLFNQPFEKEAYEAKLKEFCLDTFSSLERAKQSARMFWLTRPHKFIHARMNSNVTGDYVYTSKNARDVYQVRGVEDSRYCSFLTLGPTKDSYDYTVWGNNASRIYECTSVGEYVDDVQYSFDVWGHCMDVVYSTSCGASSHLFGCSKLGKKEYCILNKQYSAEAYEALRARIVRDMNEHPYVDERGVVYRYGEFLPPSFSPAAYNETDAVDYFPLTKAEALRQGYRWYGPEPSPHKPTLLAPAIPDCIGDVPDAIVNEIIECEGCKKAFRIVAAELALLRRFGFPVPRRCPNCRHRERHARVNPPVLYDRRCAKCGIALKTSYAPDRPEIVYCEACYNAEVV